MTQHRVSASGRVEAPAAHVYAILADYHAGHPQILPKQYFLSLEVEQGGIGAGTIIRVQMRVLGKIQTFRATVSEPEPGHVLVETDLATPLITTFTVEPIGEGQTEVTISTELQTRSGLLGVLERFATTMLLRRVYKAELEQLAGFAEERMRHKPA